METYLEWTDTYRWHLFILLAILAVCSLWLQFGSKKPNQKRLGRILPGLFFIGILFGNLVPGTIRDWGVLYGPEDLVRYAILLAVGMMSILLLGWVMKKRGATTLNELFGGMDTKPMRKFSDKKLVIASHNAGKVREIGELLAPHGIEVFSAGELDLDEPEETGTTFIDNAVIKAEAAAKASGLPALADDSGLAVHALGGEPGIHSARWAGPKRDFTFAMQKVEEALEGKADRGAFFACALALCWPDGHCETFEGRVFGALVWPPRGERGFGYDPVFQPNGHAITFGEMEPAKKHAMSHRADAFRKLVAACF